MNDHLVASRLLSLSRKIRPVRVEGSIVSERVLERPASRRRFLRQSAIVRVFHEVSHLDPFEAQHRGGSEICCRRA